jgi:hypothetical protein
MFDNENTSSRLEKKSEEELSRLDSAFSDPLLKRALDQAAEWNAVLNNQYISDDEKRAIINELDTSLGDIVRSKVRFTGHVDVSFADGSNPKKIYF